MGNGFDEKKHELAKEGLVNALPQRETGNDEPLSKTEFMSLKDMLDIYLTTLNIRVKYGSLCISLVEFCKLKGSKPTNLIFDNL